MQNKFNIREYIHNLSELVNQYDWRSLEILTEKIHENWNSGAQVFLCGNGGSAANAIHLANDLIYAVSKKDGMGLRVNALCANQAVMTCLANDISYDEIYSQQLKVLGNKGDILIVFSGSGNSPNIIKAVETAKSMGIFTSAFLGYSGGKCKAMVDLPVHFEINDMQIAEDCQQIAGHIIMRILGSRGK